MLWFELTWISVPASIVVNILLVLFFAIPPKAQRNGRVQMRTATK